MFKTYSFADIILTLNHPDVGQKVITGTGMGSATVAYANDMTAHDTAADGSVMISKIKTQSGTLSIAVQQTSDANDWLSKWANYLIAAPTNKYAETTGVLKNLSTGQTVSMSGITPQKKPDAAYQQSGQQITWALLVAEINEA